MISIPSKQKLEDFQAKLPTVILVSEKGVAPPLYKSLAVSFKGRVSFGFVRKGSKEADALKVREFPSLVLTSTAGTVVSSNITFNFRSDQRQSQVASQGIRSQS